jgi:glycosyltransferase involved in cell wall biosynthesis
MISAIIVAYNEENRIEAVLQHATKWADEVIVINKSSTDATETIALKYNAKCVTVPFQPRGTDCLRKYASHANNPWIFGLTCSEIPTKQLIESVKQAILTSKDTDEIIFIPKKMYILGIHCESSPWGIHYHPFVFRKDKVVITDNIHEHLTLSPYGTQITIPFAPNCCVHHFTHPTFDKYMSAISAYTKKEASESVNPTKDLQTCITSIIPYLHNRNPNTNQWPLLLALWIIYRLMKFCYLWEAQYMTGVEDTYQRNKSKLLNSDWDVPLRHPTNPTGQDRVPDFPINEYLDLISNPSPNSSQPMQPQSFYMKILKKLKSLARKIITNGR